MILTGERLYLNRLWRNELTVARFFSETNAPLPCDEAQLRQTLDGLFSSGEAIDWQKVAAAVALTRRISVISGGPGTENHYGGKTPRGADSVIWRAEMPYPAGRTYR